MCGKRGTMAPMAIPRKRRKHYLTPYRRHAPNCTEKKSDVRCDCPISAQGRIHGRYVRVSLNTRSMGEAEKEIAHLLHAPDDGPGGGLRMISASGGMTIADAAETFLSAKKSKSTHTQDAYRTAIERFGKYAQEHSITAIRSVTGEFMEKYFDECQDWKKASTRYGRLVRLRVFFNYCVKKDWIPKSPAQHVENVERPKGHARSAYSRQEIAAILDAVERLPEAVRVRSRALILLLLYSGMRISDAAWVERASLNERNVLDYYVIKTSKRIDLAPELQAAAVDALSQLPPSRVFFFQRDRDDDYAEARAALRRGEHFEKHLPAGVYDRARFEAMGLVARVLALAGVKGGCHRFRDTFAMTLLTNEVDIFTVSQMLGHSDVRITQKHYLNLIPGYIERMAQSTRKLNFAA